MRKKGVKFRRKVREEKKKEKKEGEEKCSSWDHGRFILLFTV